MRKTVKNLNKLYESAFENMEKASNFLSKNCIDNAKDFHFGHKIKIGKRFANEMYPIPRICCHLLGIKTEIFFDVYTNKNYIGYIKLYPNKEELLSFNMEIFASLKYLVYGFYNYQEKITFENLEEAKTKIKQSKENKFIVYTDFESIKQIFEIIEKLLTKPTRDFLITNYKCDCGHYISIEVSNGACPICGKETPYKRKFKTNCPVCNAKCLKDQYGNGECACCGWILDSFGEENPDSVIYPNLISLNKAIKLYKENQPMKPDLNDFLEAFEFYGETGFEYKNLTFCLFRHGDNGIEMGWGPNDDEVAYFKDKEDFIKNAKIENEYVRDIWDKVENPCYL